jgi:membrane-bound lytic murein transglycosylase B
MKGPRAVMIARPFALALTAALLAPVVAHAQGSSVPKATPGATAQRPAAAAQPGQAQSAANTPPAATPAAPGAPVQVPPAFVAFLNELWPDARAKGVTRQTFDLAFAGVAPDPRIMPITQRQPEFGQSVGTYLANFASKSRIETGIRKAAEHGATLEAVEREFGVDRFLVLAIWGVETNYGNSRGDRWDVIRSLATLAQARWRHPYFRDELITALLVLQEKHITREAMLGSWAGAMGQPQFMPSSFREYAVDFTGDGKRDIWTSVPDVLASIANYFRKKGWIPGLPPAFEVTVPAGFDFRQSRGTYDDWRLLGVQRVDGEKLPATGEAIMFFPSGARGPAFLVTDNFVVIKRYNNSDVYALAATHLADRMRGRGPIQGQWPADDRQLSMAERIALQKKLAELGYTIRNFTGHFDFELRDAVRDMQLKAGLVPDGHPTAAVLTYAGVTVR